ncbi:carbon monoxide dehydrogenase accessory protein CooC [soil metagenome]
MRIAFVGKGGSGKSTVAGTIARLLAREGEKVLALDVDTLPGLAFSVGLGHIPEAGLPEELGERREGEGWVLREEVSAESLVEQYSLDGPDGIRFLQLGKLPGKVRPGSTIAFRHVVESFRTPGWSIVGDLAAGTRQGFFGWAGFASLLAIVAEPSQAALLSARRLRRLAEMMPEATVGLIVNQLRDGGSPQDLAADLQLPLWGEVPYDEEVAAAERAGLAPIDAAPGSRAVAAIGALVEELHRINRERGQA